MLQGLRSSKIVRIPHRSTVSNNVNRMALHFVEEFLTKVDRHPRVLKALNSPNLMAGEMVSHMFRTCHSDCEIMISPTLNLVLAQ